MNDPIPRAGYQWRGMPSIIRVPLFPGGQMPNPPIGSDPAVVEAPLEQVAELYQDCTDIIK